MSYKTILVHVGIERDAGDPVPAALSIGECFGSTVVGFGSVAWDPYVDPALGYAPASAIDRLQQEVVSDLKTAEVRFRAACSGYRYPSIWRPSFSYPTRGLIQQSGGADLIVAARAPQGADARYYLDATEAVMQSGLPVLLAPRGRASIRPGTIVVGWKNTAATRRAIRAALPMLKAAERVVVVQICTSDEDAAAAARLEEVTQGLGRHGVMAEWRTVRWLGLEPDEDLENAARSWAADMVVLGVYGQSRLREWAWGGVSRDVLADFPFPVLLAH